jgi:ADP-ribosyl-[dinitrogen reductase] hydrolase
MMLDELIAEGRLPLSSDALETLAAPPALGMVSFDRVEGMLLGLAIGDALGNTTESELPKERQPVRDYLPNKYANGLAVGVPSDDTQR